MCCGVFWLGQTVLAAPPALSPKSQYMLRCAGCHQQDGTGTQHGDVPSMLGAIGHFTRLSEGRAFLVQVPGTLNAGLTDGEIASLLNWLLPTYGGGSLPADFKPYTEDEVSQLRRTAPANVAGRREEIVRRLHEAGYVVP